MGDEEGQFESRIKALRNRGFDVVAPTGDLASEEMLRLEEMVEYAAKVRVKVLDLPEHRSDERQRLLSQLTNPMDANSVDIELSGLLRRHRPWVILAERSRATWSSEGRSVELTHVLERLDAIDDAIVMGSPRILSMIEGASPTRDIEPVLLEIERRQRRRVEALEGMLEMLREHGWDLGKIEAGTIEEQFSEAERIYELDAILSRCKRKIENDIRPFGRNIAERLMNGISRAQSTANEDGVNRIKSEIDACSDDLSQRLYVVESRIAAWQSEGFTIPATLPLLANEMLTWEVRLPEISDQIESMRLIWTQIEPHLYQWPEYRALAERTLGHLGAVDALDVLLQGLQAKTDGAKSDCNSRLEKWNSNGIDISYWAPLVASEPRAVLQELDDQQPFIDLVIGNINRLESLDTSIDGEGDVENWLQKLRSRSVGMDVVSAVQDWLNLATKRRERHRHYLNNAKMNLEHVWPSDLDSRTLDLAMYEATISNLISEPYKPNLSNPRALKKLPTLIPVVKKKPIQFSQEINQEITDLEVQIEKKLIDVQKENVDSKMIENHEQNENASSDSDSIQSEDVDELEDDGEGGDVVPSSKKLLELFGVDEIDSNSFTPPLDVRVQRMARIANILINRDSIEHQALFADLRPIAKKLESWTAERLSRRHASSGDGLLNDARALGERLADIPGPGAAMPLEQDNFKLPDVDDLDGLKLIIKRLEKSVMLPSASIQVPEPVES